MDGTWIPHFTLDSSKAQTSEGKVMASVNWNAHGIYFIDYLPKEKTIDSEYYQALLDRLADVIKQKRPHMGKKQSLFHQDNAPCH